MRPRRGTVGGHRRRPETILGNDSRVERWLLDARGGGQSVRVISFRIDDVEEIQEVVNHPLGDVDPWELLYCQTERGPFDGSYMGAVLPREPSALGAADSMLGDEGSSASDALLRDPAIYTSRQQYARRLHVAGRAPSKLRALIVPLTDETTLHQKGQLVASNTVLALDKDEELDVVTRPSTEFLSVNLTPHVVDGLACALGRKGGGLPSGVLRPDARALSALKRQLLSCFMPGADDIHQRKLAAARLMSSIEERLIEIFDTDPRSPAHVGTTRRLAILCLARDYMHAHLDRPIRAAELCRVTGVSSRTLQYVFKWYFGVSPGTYHKYLRLKHVHRELRRLSPCAVSVTEAALSRGFTHLGRFAGEYKSVFGESPSETLASQRHIAVSG